MEHTIDSTKPEVIHALFGEICHDFLQRALQQAKAENRQFVVIHNGKEVLVTPSSEIDVLYAAWSDRNAR